MGRILYQHSILLNLIQPLILPLITMTFMELSGATIDIFFFTMMLTRSWCQSFWPNEVTQNRSSLVFVREFQINDDHRIDTNINCCNKYLNWFDSVVMMDLGNSGKCDNFKILVHACIIEPYKTDYFCAKFPKALSGPCSCKPRSQNQLLTYFCIKCFAQHNLLDNIDWTKSIGKDFESCGYAIYIIVISTSHWVYILIMVLLPWLLGVNHTTFKANGEWQIFLRCGMHYYWKIVATVGVSFQICDLTGSGIMDQNAFWGWILSTDENTN